MGGIGLNSLLRGNGHDLAGKHIPDELGTYRIQSAGLTGQKIRIVSLADA